MKKTLLTLLLLSAVFRADAQINTLPFTQGFEQAFGTGINAEFLANFTGNEVAATNRIFQDFSRAHSGTASCAVVPTSGFDGEILVRLDLTGRSNVFASFWASSEINGTGTRPDLVYMSTSIDGGLTFTPEVQIGDSSIFANTSTAWNQYQYVFPYVTYNQPNVLLRILVTRGDGTGTSAKWLLDDLTFDFSLTDISPPTALNAFSASSASTVVVAFDEPVSVSAENTASYSGLPAIASAARSAGQDSVILTLSSPLVEGQWYTLTVQSIQDLAGNSMTGPRSFIVVFNDNTGLVVITEIMYNNPGDDSLTFVEVRNKDTQPINVGGWRFTDGAGGLFPSGQVLAPEEYVVFATYPAFVEQFFGITGINALEGNLSNSGENLAFSNTIGQVIDSVTYEDALPWDTLANGFGYSLVLCDENSDNDLASNWTHALTGAGVFNADSIYANPGSDCSGTIGILETAAEIRLTCYPNPAMDQVSVKLPVQFSGCPVTFSLLDASGHLLESGRIQSADRFITGTGKLPSGLYQLRFDCSGLIATARLIIVR